MKRHLLRSLCSRMMRSRPFFAAVVVSLILMAPLFQTAHAYRFERVTNFEGWWEWTNSPNVDFYYSGDSVKIHSHAVAPEDYAEGSVGQNLYRSCIGAMSTVDIENAVGGYSHALLYYLDIGKRNDCDLQAQISIAKWPGTDNFVAQWVFAEQCNGVAQELERVVIGELTGTTFTIAVARIENDLLFYVDGYDVVVYTPEFDMGPQGYGWCVNAVSASGANIEATFRDIYAIDTGEPRPTITANGSGIPTTVSPATTVSIDIALDPGDETGHMADWWVAVNTPFAPPNNWYTYVYPTGWHPGVHLCAQTPLFGLSTPVNVLNSTLPVGDYTFYFAVDNNADGIPDATWMDSVPVSVCNPSFFDTFDGLSLDGNKWDLNAIWNGNSIDSTEYFLDPHVAGGSLIFQDKGNLPLLKDSNQAWTGVPTKDRVITGDFEFITYIKDFQVNTVSPGPGRWYGNMMFNLETSRTWGTGYKIIINENFGNNEHGDYHGFGLTYYINEIPQNIGCPSVGGTNCWIAANAVEGDKTRVTVRRTGNNVAVYIGDTLFHSFDGAATEDMYISPKTGVWNETSGTIINYYAEIPEMWVFPK